MVLCHGLRTTLLTPNNCDGLSSTFDEKEKVAWKSLMKIWCDWPVFGPTTDATQQNHFQYCSRNNDGSSGLMEVVVVVVVVVGGEVSQRGRTHPPIEMRGRI